IEWSDLRIGRVLDDVGYTPTYWSLNHTSLSVLGTTTTLGGAGDNARVLMVGETDVQAASLDHEPTLSHMQAVTQAENGRFVVRGDGVVVFLDRAYADTAVPYRAIFGEPHRELAYTSLAPEHGRPLYTLVS